MNGFDEVEQEAIAAAGDAGVVIHIKGLDKQPMFYTAEDGTRKPVTVTAATKGSNLWNRQLKAARRQKIDIRGLTGEKVHSDIVQRTAATTLSWDGFYRNGVAVPFSYHNAAAMYDKWPYLLDQVAEVQEEPAQVFTPPSLEPSPT